MKALRWFLLVHLVAAGPSLTATGIADPVSCPRSDGQEYEAPSGDRYMVDCHVERTGLGFPLRTFAGHTADDCLWRCTQDPDCSFSSWGKRDGGGDNCWLKASVETWRAKYGSWSMIYLRKATQEREETETSSPCPQRGASSTLATRRELMPRSVPQQTEGSRQEDSVYAARCGAHYLIEQGDLDGEVALISSAASLDECIAVCGSTEDCTGVLWARRSTGGSCHLNVKPAVSGRSSSFHATKRTGCSSTPSSQQYATRASGFSFPATAITPINPTSSLYWPTISSFSVSPVAQIPLRRGESTTTTASAACTAAPVLAAGALPDCVPCEGQPGNDPDDWCGLDIYTNFYEEAPKTCRVVSYSIDITNSTIAPDGITRMALLINGSMPGPPIRASWGDTVVVTVNNRLHDNGTSIHFHGVRQTGNSMNDGVPSITQCPIAPGASMTYTWVANSYGTSWYHSHFAIQTWEGVFAPLIIDGPRSMDFDNDLGAFFLQDWSHATVDSMYDLAQDAVDPAGGRVKMDTGLINGMNTWGDADTGITGQRLRVGFAPGESHLLRIVNAAIQSTFKFMIDEHTMTVIAVDFVPIEPYETQVLNVNIGQRYDVIVNADQLVGTYWMRADNQDTCGETAQGKDIKAVVNYLGAAGTEPATDAYEYTDECIDEDMADIVPILPLNAGPADITEGVMDVVVANTSAKVYKWYLSGATFQSQYDNPTLVDIFNENSTAETGNLVFDVSRRGEIVYIILQSPIPVPHPIHLHGHDFWLLATGTGTYNSSVPLKLENPPRRDTVLLPANGYIVLAFEVGNPGVWLMHCHIGWHSAMGLALQFLELKDEIRSSGSLDGSCTVEDTCAAWTAYVASKGEAMKDSGV
ncbi:hypothetical protein EJ06DRAFT_177362 [Trichodelitschia bisporula]|uniref:Multicopper oxidase n=1 Tax=Trichodelitschia bisporula TaxID=703511 RepID=A0A6G1HLK9_9PEZI|nr:hypothetical protein EJ06DRAFT_177362 [Trichodelitschia bisporula]